MTYLINMHLKPHLILNILAKARLINKVNYLTDMMKCNLMDQSEESVLIFECGQDQALQNLRSVKNPTLSMGFIVDLELIIDNKVLRLVATTEFFGPGSLVVGVFDKDPIVPRLSDKFLLFKGHYTLREFYFKDDRVSTNPKHLFRISTGSLGQTSELELISETVLVSLHAKRQEVSFVEIHNKFHKLLLDNETVDSKEERPAKRPRDGDAPAPNKSD